MTGPAPRVAVEFTGDTDPVTLAVRELVASLKGLDRTQADLTTSSNRLSAASVRSAAGFSTMVSWIRRLASSYLVLRTAAFVKDSLEAADAIGKLAQKTGAGTEALSVFAVAATTADVSQESLEKGLVRLSRTLDDANGGSKEAATTLRRLGLSASEIKNIKVDEAFLRIANAVAALPGGYQRAALAQKAFGKGGAELIPLLLDLSGKGMAEAEARARSMGLVFSRDATDAAQVFNDTLTDLKNAARGAAVQFGSGLAPAITQVVRSLTDGASAVQSGSLAELGRSIGNVLKTILSNTATQVADVETLLARIQLAAANAKAVAQFVSGNVQGASVTFQLARTDFTKTIADITARRDKTLADLNAPPPTPTHHEGDGSGGGSSGGVDTALEKARLDARKQAIQDELQLEEIKARTYAQINQAQYDQGLQSLALYFQRRRGLLQAGTAAEIAALVKQRDLVLQQQADTPAARETRAAAAAALEAQIARKRLETDQQDAQLTADQAAALAALQAQRLGFEAQLQAAKGQTLQVALDAIEQEAKRFDALLVKQGVQAPERAAQVGAFRDVLTLRAQLADVQTRATAVLDDIARGRQAIANNVTTGVLTERQGQEQVAALERDRLPVLQQLAAMAGQLAANLRDPAAIAAAADLSSQLATMAASADLAAQDAARFKAGIADSLESAFSTFLGNTINDVENARDAFLSLFADIARGIQQVTAQLLAAQITRGLLGLFSAGASANFDVGAPEIVPTTLPGFARGGLVPGAGTGDTVPAMLTPGEGVLTTREIRALGGAGGFAALRRALSDGLLLPPIRRSGIQHLNHGGLVARDGGGEVGGGAGGTF